MTKPADYLPKLRRHKAKDLAYVCFSGRALYLGKWGSKEAKARYDKLIAEWLDRGRVPPPKPGVVTAYRIDDLVADYFEYLEGRFPDSREPERMGYALDALSGLFGASAAAEFTLPMLRIFRDHQIKAGLSRNGVNKRTAHIKRMFKWGARFKKVPFSAWNEVSLIEPLRRGEAGVREAEGIRYQRSPWKHRMAGLPPGPRKIVPVGSARFSACVGGGHLSRGGLRMIGLSELLGSAWSERS